RRVGRALASIEAGPAAVGQGHGSKSILTLPWRVASHPVDTVTGPAGGLTGPRGLRGRGREVHRLSALDHRPRRAGVGPDVEHTAAESRFFTTETQSPQRGTDIPGNKPRAFDGPSHGTRAARSTAR